MKNPKFWMAVLAGGLVANVMDFLVMGMALASTFAGIESVRQENNVMWFVIGDFFAAFAFMLVYDRVYGSFSPGPKGGATFGAYAGFLVSFPTWIFVHLMFTGFPYGLAWGLIVYGIIWGAVVGSVLGSVYRK